MSTHTPLSTHNETSLNEDSRARKIELIDDALLENVSGGTLDDSVCVPVQFCYVPPVSEG